MHWVRVALLPKVLLLVPPCQKQSQEISLSPPNEAVAALKIEE